MALAESASASPGGMFRSLRHRNYRLFFMGHSVSLIGNWLQWAAMNWLVFELTGSPRWLGIVGFCRISILFVAPFAGILADRFERRKLVVITQALATIQPFLLGFLTLTGLINEWCIVALSIYAGIIAAFDIPVRQSLTVELVGNKADLGNAIALNSSMVNGARLIGPAIAGLLIWAVGEGWCFLLNGLSYLPVIVALLMMEFPARPRQTKRRHVLRELKEGVRYAFGFAPIRTVLLLLCTVSIMGMPFQQLMSAFAQDVLHVGPRIFGLLTGCVGIGAVAGAMTLARRRSAAGLENLIPVATTIFGLGLVAFSMARVWWLAMPMLVIVGFGMMVQMASSNTFLQTICDDDKRGRVMSFYAMAFMGTGPLGQLLGGYAADLLSLPTTLLISGLCCLVAAGLYTSRLRRIRRQVIPIYRQMGLVRATAGAPAVNEPPVSAASNPSLK